MKDEVLAEMLDGIVEKQEKATCTAGALFRLYHKNVDMLRTLGYTVEVVDGKHIVSKEDKQ